VKNYPHKKPPTFGDLIQSGYRTCGKRWTKGIIQPAAKACLIVVKENEPFVIF
jgi:hypothetical protein